MRVRRTVAVGIATAMTLAVGVFASAAPNDDGSNCDPDNGKYFCDGYDDHVVKPDGSPAVPSTGVSQLPMAEDDDLALSGDDGVSSSLASKYFS